MKVLTVTQPFGSYAVGARITDAKEIETILASEQRPFVVRTEEADPKPAANAKDAT